MSHAPPTPRTAAAAAEPGSPLWRLVPALGELRTYTWRTFGADAGAGLTVAAVAVPQAMAYALIVGLPPEVGLYTAIVMTAVGALFDASRKLINGPTNAMSIALFSALAAEAGGRDPAALAAAAALMALLVGGVQVGITLLRLGDLTRYISHAVIVGFTLGASALLVLDQLKNLLGLPARADGKAHFLRRFQQDVLAAGQAPHAWTLALGAGAILLVLALRRLNARFLARRGVRIPEFLVAVVAAAAAVAAFGLESKGVRTIGEVPRQLPSFAWPAFDPDLFRRLAPSALAAAVLGLLEALAMAKALAAQTRERLDVNQQCLSEGLANVAGSLFGCMPGSGSLTRSAINHAAGARTQWSGVISAAAVALVVVAFAPWARHIPRSALAGILMLTAFRMVPWKELRFYLGATRSDAAIVLATALSAALISIEFCILIGTFLSFLLYVPRAARLHVGELVVTPERLVRERVLSDPVCRKLGVFDFEGEFFFGSAQELDDELRAILRSAEQGTRVVALRLRRVRNADAGCLHLLADFVGVAQAQGVSVLFCGVRSDLAAQLAALPNVRFADEESLLWARSHAAAHAADRAPLSHALAFREQGGAWSSTLAAVRFAYELLGRDLCAECPRRADDAGKSGEQWHYMI